MTSSSLPKELMEFLANETEGKSDTGMCNPPVIITCGTANPFCKGSDHFLALAQVLHKLKCRSIILTSESTYVPQELPPGSIHFPFLPLPALLQHCCACIHHGGIGTIAECFRAGIPQVWHTFNAFVLIICHIIVKGEDNQKHDFVTNSGL